jgi:hypothetical protein
MEFQRADLKIELEKGSFADLAKRVLDTDITSDNSIKLLRVNSKGDVSFDEYISNISGKRF